MTAVALFVFPEKPELAELAVVNSEWKCKGGLRYRVHNRHWIGKTLVIRFRRINQVTGIAFGPTRAADSVKFLVDFQIVRKGPSSC